MHSPFVNICSELMALAGLPSIDADSDENGIQTLSFEMEGAVVQLISEGDAASPIFGRVVLCAQDACGEDGFWDAVLGLNFERACRAQPALVRDPDSGELMSQQAWAPGTTAQDILSSLTRTCRAAAAGADGPAHAFADTGARRRQEASLAHETPQFREADALFERLVQDLRSRFAPRDFSVDRQPSGLATLALWLGDAEFQIFRLPEDPLQLHLFGTMGTMGLKDTATLAADQLSEINACLLAEPHSAVICVRPGTAEHVLHTALALRADSMSPLMRMAAAQQAAIADIAAQLAAQPEKSPCLQQSQA